MNELDTVQGIDPMLLASIAAGMLLLVGIVLYTFINQDKSKRN